MLKYGADKTGKNLNDDKLIANSYMIYVLEPIQGYIFGTIIWANINH